MNTFSEKSIEEIQKKFSVNSTKGLSFAAVRKRIEKYGENVLPEKKKSRLKMLLSQFKSPLIFILLLSVLISAAIPFFTSGHFTGKDVIEPIAIFIIVVLNALFGFFQELKAENTLQALKQMQPNECTVLRNSKKIQISAKNIVPGDILILAEGDTIPADARLLKTVSFTLIESALTGESVPSSKDARWQGKGGIGDQKNMVFAGTMVATGRALALVVATGAHTEIGHIARLVTETETPKTPLENRLDLLGKKISVAILAICIFIFLLFLFQGKTFAESLIVAVALAVSAIPEGLPAVMTISLAIGVAVMAKKKALIRNLKAVEALGSITCIASDKTGTITQNKMTVMSIFCDEKFYVKDFKKSVGNDYYRFEERSENIHSLREFKKSKKALPILNIAASCNDAELPNIGDPTEIALLQFAYNNGAKKMERIGEIPFSSETKWMGTMHRIGKKDIEFIKGAPEVVATFCKKNVQKTIQNAAKKMAEKGLRTIAVAIQQKGKKAEFLGIFGLLDPPRPTVVGAIKKASIAGIRTVMITGDHAITATTIAHRVGIKGEAITGEKIEKMTEPELRKAVRTTHIFARVSPEHKVRICKALQYNGHVVAMTGDGVNDAPAIHRAEVGISMGKIGTSVARQASDLILLDDHYATIVKGVEEGRRIFENIKKSVSFLLRTNFGEVLLITATTLVALPLPMLPIHILFLNLVTDSFPALALAAEKAEKNIMKEKPRSISEGFLHKQIRPIIILGSGMAIISLAVFLITSQYLPLLQVQTLVLTTVIAIEFSVIFSIRRSQRVLGVREKKSTKNPWILRSVFVGISLYAIALFTPLSSILELELFPLVYWLYPVAAAFFLFMLSEGMKKKSN